MSCCRIHLKNIFDFYLIIETTNYCNSSNFSKHNRKNNEINLVFVATAALQKSFEIRIDLPCYLTHQNHNWKDVKQNSTLFACLLFAAQLSS